MKTLYNEFWKKLEDKPNKSTFNLGEIAQKYLDSINLGNNTSNDLAKYENFKGQWKYIIYRKYGISSRTLIEAALY